MIRPANASAYDIVAGIFLAVALSAAVPRALYAAEPRVEVELTNERIYIGESVRYRVTLHDCDPSIEPQLDHFNDFERRLIGKTSGSQSTVIVNGQLRSFTQSGPTYEYLLTPKRSGKLIVPAAKMEVGGKTYEGTTLQLEVLDPEEQDIVFMEITADPAEVYPLQRFTVKLNVAVKALPDPAGDREPITVQSQLPQLIVPWADDDNLPDGVKPREPAAEWLRGMLDDSRRPSGFAINNIRARGRSRLGGFPNAGGFPGFPDMDQLMEDSGFPEADSLLSMFREETRAAFHPPAKKTTRKDLKERRVGYWEYSFDRIFTAEKLGELRFGPVNMKGAFATRSNTRGELEGERIYAVAKAISVRVKDAPVAGRPANYIGGIGQFEAGAELNPTAVKVGDPMTLNLWIQGEGTLANVSAPDIGADPAIAANFKIYEATDQTSGDQRRFTYSMRPKQPDIREFPAIAMSYFDVSQEKYLSLQTKPIPIQVAPADKLTEAEIALPASGPADSRDLEARVEGVFANITDPSQLRNEKVQPKRYLLLISIMLGAFAVVLVMSKHLRRASEDVAGQRRRAAARRAKERLAERPKQASSQQSAQAADQISSALRGLIADWISEGEQSLTTGDVRQQLSNRQIEPAVINRTMEVLENCDAARYGAGTIPIDQLAEQAHELIDDLNAELKKRFRFERCAPLKR